MAEEVVAPPKKEAAPNHFGLKVGRSDDPKVIQREQNKPQPKEEQTEDVVIDYTLEEENKGGEKKDIKAGDAKDKDKTSKLNLSRFKEYVGKDVESEDELENAFKERDTKLSKLQVLAQSGSKLKDDKDYQAWKGYLGESNENLVAASLTYEYMQDGLSQEQASVKAKEKIEKNQKNNEDFVDDSARQIRKTLKQSIAQREEQVQKEIEEASKDISFTSPDSNFEAKVKEQWSKTDEFLGMKLAKDEKERVKLLGESYLNPKQMNEALKDPATYNEVCYYLKYKKQLKANVLSRTNGKAKVLDRLSKTSSLGGITSRNNVNAPSNTGFNGNSFLGR